MTLLRGDCLELLKTLVDNSVDSIVTDPPYELGFMGKAWDNSGIAYNVDLWRECLRVLKPGGHLLAFGGSRTYHRMATAIEDAGFEVRDQIMWIYGSGFPKSLDVSKAIDRAAGADREVVGEHPNPAKSIYTQGQDDMPTAVPITAPATPDARTWQGWGTALKPAHEPIVVARKPFSGTVAANVLQHGTGALNIDGCRVNFSGESDESESKGKNRHADFGSGARENAVYNADTRDRAEGGNYDPSGRWPANVVHDGSEEVLAAFPTSKSRAGVPRSGENGDGWGMRATGAEYDDEGSAARFFYTAKASSSERNAGLDGLPERITNEDTPPGQKGSESPRAGAGRGGARQNFHPTVKPLALMRYLVRLVTPPGGVVLDPFLGSGTTAVAAILEGSDWLGCEMTDEYWPIIEARVAWAQAQEVQGELLVG